MFYCMVQMSLTINKEMVLRIVPNRADNTAVAEGAHGHAIFV